MSQSNRKKDIVTVKRNDTFADVHTVNGKLCSSSPDNSSLGEESSYTRNVSRKFNIPTSTFNKIFKPPRASQVRRVYLPSPRRTNELQLDNGEHLSGLMSMNDKSTMGELDQSFASDFDESFRWLK